MSAVLRKLVWGPLQHLAPTTLTPARAHGPPAGQSGGGARTQLLPAWAGGPPPGPGCTSRPLSGLIWSWEELRATAAGLCSSLRAAAAVLVSLIKALWRPGPGPQGRSVELGPTFLRAGLGACQPPGLEFMAWPCLPLVTLGKLLNYPGNVRWDQPS